MSRATSAATSGAARDRRVRDPMRVDLFDYALPPERIALAPGEPARIRAAAACPAPTGLSPISTIADLPRLIRPGDALVVNDTRVIPARLYGRRERGEARRARSRRCCSSGSTARRWRALVRPAKKLNVGERVRFGETADSRCPGALDATVEDKGEGGETVFAFDLSGPALDEAIERIGRDSAAALYRSAPAGGSAGPRRLSNHVRRRARRRRRADRRPAFHAGADLAGSRAPARRCIG